MFSDHFGSNASTHNVAANTTARLYYHPYSDIRSNGNFAIDDGYTGQKLDDSTGLMFYDARSPSQAKAPVEVCPLGP